MQTLLDELEGPRKTYMVIAAIALLLAAVKVRNELKMTEAYDRQAFAQERQAVALEQIAEATRMGVLVEQGCGQ